MVGAAVVIVAVGLGVGSVVVVVVFTLDAKVVLNVAVVLSLSLVLLPTLPTSLERWSICGPRSAVVTALGTITTDNALSGWSRTWT